MGLFCIILSFIFSHMSDNSGSSYDGRTTATVVGLRAMSSEDGVVYAPVVEFFFNGRRYTVSRNFGTSPCKYAVGEIVEIRFDTRNPKRFAIAGDKSLKSIAKTFKIVGIVLLAMDFMFLLVCAGSLLS